MVPVPIAVGFIVALALRELYIRQGGTFEELRVKNEELRAESREVNADSEPETRGDDGEPSESAESPQAAVSDAAAVDAVSVPAAEPAAAESVAERTGEQTEAPAAEPAVEPVAEPQPAAVSPVAAAPKNVFDEAASPSDERINNAVEDMLDDENPVVPSDLSSRLAETAAETPAITDDDDDSGIWNGDEDDIMSRLQDSIGEENITFSDAEANEDGIAPTAAEILGADFDFDSLLNQTHETPQPESTDAAADSVANDNVANDTAFSADTFVPFNGEVSKELESVQRDTALSFSADLVSDTAVEPDYAVAERFSFTEELRPMFTAKRRK